MKLDYLQYLELEAFTRFSTKLETTAQAVIKRGRVLKELLKQERLEPVSIELQLVWLIAFNDHKLDDLPPEALKEVWKKLKSIVIQGNLKLDLQRKHWSAAIDKALGSKVDSEGK